MSFQVLRSSINNTTIIHLIDNNHSTGISVIPAAGALLHEFIVPLKGEPFNIIENYPLNQPVNEQVTQYFRSVKLSPWPCRLDKGQYQFNGENFQVQKLFSDGTALHGLLFDQPFNIVDEFADDNNASVVLKHSYRGYDPGYPFHYTCEVKYTLHPAATLEVETRVTNLSHENIPISDGWHPYFKLGGKLNNWELFFNSSSMLEFNEKLIPTGRLIPFNQFNEPSPIGEVKMDNCFLLNVREGQAACTLKNPANNVKVSFFPSTAYPYLQIFIPDYRESIAIENLSGAPDCFNNQSGLLVLQPGHSQTFRLFYRVSVEEKS